MKEDHIVLSTSGAGVRVYRTVKSSIEH